MASTERSVYLRIKISGRLECKNALHIGDGRLQPLKDRDAKPRSKRGEGSYNSVCLARDRPYLPASTLRGFLRDIAFRTDHELGRRLFGYAGKDQDRCGAVRMYDAPLASSPPKLRYLPSWSPTRRCALRHAIALDPLTATVDEHHLYCDEYVPAGSVFDVEIEADEVSEDDLARLLGLLECWDGTVNSAVGKGASRCQGRLRWYRKQYKVEVLDREALKRWLASDDPLTKHFTVLKSPVAQQPAVSPRVLSVRFHIQPSSPLLVNEPGLVLDQQGDPNCEYSRTPDGLPMIPASSLRGLLRGRAQRILATLTVARGIAPCAAGEMVKPITDELFGQTGARSPIWISDAVADDAGEPREQIFNAVDRFTGGVSDGKLYKVKGVVCQRLGGEVHLESDLKRRPKGNWWKGLLLLVLRDALEGDLAVGWGKARGYGAFRLSLEWQGAKIDTWPGLLGWLDTNQPKDEAGRWVEALHGYVEQRLASVADQNQRIHADSA